jgi:hypothetical protein
MNDGKDSNMVKYNKQHQYKEQPKNNKGVLSSEV